jgi:tetratricopeptide (TPR) repeat protein
MRKDLKTIAISYGGMFIIYQLLLGTLSCSNAPTTSFEQLSRNDFELVVGEFEGVNDIIDNYYFKLLNLKNTDTPHKKRLSVFLDSVLYDGLTIDEYLKREILIAADMEHEDYRDIMNKWYINGKYLCIERLYYGCAMNCSGRTSLYVIDTHLLKQLTLDDIFINPNNQRFEKLVMRHIEHDGGNDDGSYDESGDERDDESEPIGEFEKSLKDRNYEISYESEGIGFHWNKYVSWPGFDIVIPHAKIEPYMTQAGKASSKIDDVVWDSLFNDSITRHYEHTRLPPVQDFFEIVVKMAKDGSLYDYGYGKYGEHAGRYKTYLRIYPLSDANLVMYNDMGYYLEQAKAYDAAISVLQAIVEKYPKRIVAHLNLADAYWGDNKKENAGKHYEEYVNLMKNQGKDMSKIPQRVYDRIKPTAP